MATRFVYDEIPLPHAFHFLVGPTVIHPRATGAVRLYSGVPPARHGRRLGGVIEADFAEPASDGAAGEAGIRITDANAYGETDGAAGMLVAAGRFGFPGLICPCGIDGRSTT